MSTLKQQSGIQIDGGRLTVEPREYGDKWVCSVWPINQYTGPCETRELALIEAGRLIERNLVAAFCADIVSKAFPEGKLLSKAIHDAIARIGRVS